MTARRNLSAYDRSLLALKLEGLFREKAKENLSLAGGDRKSANAKSPCQISDKAIDTKKELAKIAGVSHDTIAKVKTIEKRATPEQKGGSGSFQGNCRKMNTMRGTINIRKWWLPTMKSHQKQKHLF